MLVRPQWLSQSWVDQVPDLDSLVSHLDNQLLATLVRVDWLGKLDGGGGMGVAVADWDEVGEAAGWVGEEGEDGVGVGRGRQIVVVRVLVAHRGEWKYKCLVRSQQATILVMALFSGEL